MEDAAAQEFNIFNRTNINLLNRNLESTTMGSDGDEQDFEGFDHMMSKILIGKSCHGNDTGGVEELRDETIEAKPKAHRNNMEGQLNFCN